jgi:outer membrane protein, multidrug efflux system
MKLTRHICCVVLSAGFLSAGSSCMTFPPPEREADAGVTPETFSLYEQGAAAPDRWWVSLQSEELNRLAADGLGGNFSIAQAVARIRQAAAVAKQSHAALLPQIGYNAGASITRRRADTGESVDPVDTAIQKISVLNQLLGSSSTGTAAGGTALDSAASAIQRTQSQLNAQDSLFADTPSSVQYQTIESYEGGLTVSYEADIWGRLRALEKASVLSFEASREDVASIMQSVASQIVLTWLDILLYDQVLEILEKQRTTNQTNLELMELRYRKGMATALDIYQQRQIVAQTRSQFPPAEAQRQVLRHALAVLLGKAPRSEIALSQKAFPEPGRLPAYGLPADLLAQRPDIRAAGLRLRAADWQVSAARADRLPSLNLSASASLGAEERDLLFDNWMARLAASITGPVFDAGRRKAEVTRTRAVVDERLAAYRQTVLTAVREVEDALVLERRQREYIAALEAQYETARNTHREALTRYQKGLTDYLPVLTALTAAQSLERSLVQARHDLLVYRVRLHLALGGSWMESELAARKG